MNFLMGVLILISVNTYAAYKFNCSFYDNANGELLFQVRAFASSTSGRNPNFFEDIEVLDANDEVLSYQKFTAEPNAAHAASNKYASTSIYVNGYVYNRFELGLISKYAKIKSGDKIPSIILHRKGNAWLTHVVAEGVGSCVFNK